MQVAPAQPFALKSESLEHAVFAQLAALLSPSPAHAPLAVALSGGADSLALTLIAQRFAAQHSGRLIAFTVDHRLRPDSTTEAQHVSALMAAHGITHQILTPQQRAISNNLQETARHWRYDALAEACRTHGILHCLVAHTASDNRETAALHTTRGDTADGSSGMALARNYRGVRFLRPLLGQERPSLESYLIDRNVTWVNDPSNHNPRFARVRLRQQSTATPAMLQEQDAALAQHAHARAMRDNRFASIAATLVSLHPLGFAEFSYAAWRALPLPLARQLLADCITTISGATHRPWRHETERLAAAMTTPFRKRTLLHCEITLNGDTVRVARELARVEAPCVLTGYGEATWDKRFRVRYELAAGMTLVLGALGAAGRKQLRALAPKAPDLPTASPALWHLDELVFVPHIAGSFTATPRLRLGFAPPKPLAAAPFWWNTADQRLMTGD